LHRGQLHAPQAEYALQMISAPATAFHTAFTRPGVESENQPTTPLNPQQNRQILNVVFTTYDIIWRFFFWNFFNQRCGLFPKLQIRLVACFSRFGTVRFAVGATVRALGMCDASADLLSRSALLPRASPSPPAVFQFIFCAL
jgi:hypothetical protein